MLVLTKNLDSLLQTPPPQNPNPTFHTSGPGPNNPLRRNSWGQQGTLTRGCAYCGDPHLDDDCPQQSILGVILKSTLPSNHKKRNGIQRDISITNPPSNPPRMSSWRRSTKTNLILHYPPPSQHAPVPGYSTPASGVMGQYNMGMGNPPGEYYRQVY
jgi:hypothetical protein